MINLNSLNVCKITVNKRGVEMTNKEILDLLKNSREVTKRSKAEFDQSVKRIKEAQETIKNLF